MINRSRGRSENCCHGACRGRWERYSRTFILSLSSGKERGNENSAAAAAAAAVAGVPERRRYYETKLDGYYTDIEMREWEEIRSAGCWCRDRGEWVKIVSNLRKKKFNMQYRYCYGRREKEKERMWERERERERKKSNLSAVYSYINVCTVRKFITYEINGGPRNLVPHKKREVCMSIWLKSTGISSSACLYIYVMICKIFMYGNMRKLPDIRT